MSAYGPPAPSRPPGAPDQRAALMSYVAGGLGLLSFVWGFLKWVTEGSGSDKKIGGYAVTSPGVAIIGFSVAAGVLAAAIAWDKKQITPAPVVFSITSLLLLIGVLIGKGSVSVPGGGSPKIGIGIGLILELITVILQVGVLVYAWMSASGRIAAKPAAQAWPQQPHQQPYPGQPGQPGPGQPGGYGPPPGYGPTQQQPPAGPPPAGPPPGYGPPPAGPGYGPPQGQ